MYYFSFYMYDIRKMIQKIHFFAPKICTYQKKAVPLQRKQKTNKEMKTKETVNMLLRCIQDNATEKVEYVCTDYDSGDGYMIPPTENYEPSYSYEFEGDVRVYNGAPLYVIAELNGDFEFTSLIIDFPADSNYYRELSEEIREQLSYCNNITFNF